MALVDMFGTVHPLPEVARIGRDPDSCDLAVLHASISSQHALVSLADGALTVADLGSLNGTFVDEERVERRAFDPRDCLLRIGVVSFALCPDVLDPIGPAPMARRTVPRGGKRPVVAFAVNDRRWDLSLGAEGAALAGEGGEIGLSTMEGRLLRVLLDRCDDPDFLPSSELVHELGFGARAADGENVRELVRRLRRKLDAFGMAALVESRRKAGYRIARHVRRL
jgi:hypothetical protein